MSSFFGPTIPGKRCLQRSDDAGGIVDRQRRLRDVREVGRVADGKRRDVGRRFDEMDATVALAHRALDLGMARVTDHHDLASVLAHLGDLDMDLGDERTGRVEHA